VDRRRGEALTEEEQASPLAKRIYDLRHPSLSLWLDTSVAIGITCLQSTFTLSVTVAGLGHGRAYVLGLLSQTERKNSWWLAEFAGESSPDGMQRLLRPAACSASTRA
jgi:hypothetical protein